MPDIDTGRLATALLESVPDLAYVTDLEAELVWWNDYFPKLTGYDDAELEGMSGFELIAEDQREAVMEAFAGAGTYEDTHTMEFDVRTKDGDLIPHEFNGDLLEVDGEPVVAAIARDVTARREREAEIRRQRDELETLNSINETVYEVIQAVVDAASREEIETAVCERLAASDLYRAVWVGRSVPDEPVEPVAGAGGPDDLLELVASVNDPDWQRPAAVATETGRAQVVQQMAASDLAPTAKEIAEAVGVNSGTAAPIVHGERVVGVVCAYSSRTEAFSERERAAFERLGEVVGFAINAVRTERLLLSDVTTELTFRVSGSDAFLASVSTEADGPCSKEWSTPLESGAGNYRHYVSIAGLDPERVLEVGETQATIESIERMGRNGDAQVFAVDTNDSFTRRLLEAGATPTSIIAEDGETRIVAELPGDADVRPVVEAANELYDAELVSKRALERPVRTTDEFYDDVADRLTDRQKAALRHAYFGGYFSWPRDATAEEIAARMDVTSPTFHYHIRHAQRALVEDVLQHLDD